MSKYLVTLAVRYEVEADDEQDAVEMADDAFLLDCMGTTYSGNLPESFIDSVELSPFKQEEE
jgi:hypothetical protein